MDKSKYKEIQLDIYKSHESKNPHWKEGQVRFINEWLVNYPCDYSILDVACGDGCGLERLKELEFVDITGFEWSEDKAKRASRFAEVKIGDMHDMSCFEKDSFDVVYSSHTLEHALNPAKVLTEFHRIIKPGGDLVLVLPYPDPSHDNVEAHCGKYILGTHRNDDAVYLESFLFDCNFFLIEKKYDNFREPEVWLRLKKINKSMKGLWNDWYKDCNTNEPAGADPTAYKKGMDFLEDCEVVEDWGCGLTYAKNFRKGKYIGIDGSKSKFVDKVVDLKNYKSNVDGIFMRGVIEHNHNWKRILENVLESFQKKFALIIFTPFSEERTKQIASNWKGIPDLSFNKEELINCFGDIKYTEESCKTNTQYGIEHIFYLKKNINRMV